MFLVIALAVEDAQDGEEEVDDVEVEADGGGDLLLDVVVAQHELGVDEDVAREDEGGEPAVDQLGRAAVGEERGHEAEQDQAPQAAEQVRHPRREVVLRLAGEQREEHEDPARQDHGVQDDAGLVERHDDRDGVGLEQREAREEEKVRRVRLALPVGEEHERDGTEELQRKVIS